MFSICSFYLFFLEVKQAEPYLDQSDLLIHFLAILIVCQTI